MNAIVDKKELKELVKKAEKERTGLKKEHKSDADKARREKNKMVKKRVDGILSSIPQSLRSAAKNAVKKDGKITVVATIFIVRERMNSIMSSRGYLEEFDKKVLNEVRQRMKTFKIEGVELSEKIITEFYIFHSADGEDSSQPGPCKKYYLEAKTVIDD